MFDELFNFTVNLFIRLTDNYMDKDNIKTFLKVMFNAGFSFGTVHATVLANNADDGEKIEEDNESDESDDDDDGDYEDDKIAEEDEPTNVLDEMDPDKLVLIESKQKDALYEGISILKYLFAAKIKDYKVGDLLLYSLMINLCEETHKGYITLDEIYELDREVRIKTNELFSKVLV